MILTTIFFVVPIVLLELYFSKLDETVYLARPFRTGQLRDVLRHFVKEGPLRDILRDILLTAHREGQALNARGYLLFLRYHKVFK